GATIQPWAPSPATVLLQPVRLSVSAPKVTTSITAALLATSSTKHLPTALPSSLTRMVGLVLLLPQIALRKESDRWNRLVKRSIRSSRLAFDTRRRLTPQAHRNSD